jgi:hypothetical protein
MATFCDPNPCGIQRIIHRVKRHVRSPVNPKDQTTTFDPTQPSRSFIAFIRPINSSLKVLRSDREANRCHKSTFLSIEPVTEPAIVTEPSPDLELEGGLRPRLCKSDVGKNVSDDRGEIELIGILITN